MTTKPLKQKPRSHRTVSIRVESYLAKYAREKFDVDPKTGGILIPDSFNLYHCVWQLMAKWPLERWNIGVNRRVDPPEGNLTVHLPFRRAEGGIAKDPRYWNYISPRAARVINRELKRLFDWEFHHYVENLLEYNPSITKKEAVARFAKKYALGIDTEDALLKNFQRHERKVRIFLGLKKRKSATTSTTILSCRVPALLQRPENGEGGSGSYQDKNPLARLISQGVQLLENNPEKEVFEPEQP